MTNVTSETIKANYPQVWWEIYRTGFREAMESPEMQAQAAKEQLQRTLTKPKAAAPAQPSPQASAITISAEQTAINVQLGLSTEEFTKYNRAVPSQLDPVQAEINGKLGLPEEEFLRFAK